MMGGWLDDGWVGGWMMGEWWVYDRWVGSWMVGGQIVIFHFYSKLQHEHSYKEQETK